MGHQPGEGSEVGGMKVLRRKEIPVWIAKGGKMGGILQKHE